MHCIKSTTSRKLVYSQSGQQPLKGILQIPQLSSLATHNQEATPFHCRIFTFIVRSDNRRKLSDSLPEGPRQLTLACELMLTSDLCSYPSRIISQLTRRRRTSSNVQHNLGYCVSTQLRNHDVHSLMLNKSMQLIL